MTALEEVRWGTCCGSGHGLGLRLFGALFYRTSGQVRATWTRGIGPFLTTRGPGGPSLSLTRVSLFSVRKAVEVFQKQGHQS